MSTERVAIHLRRTGPRVWCGEAGRLVGLVDTIDAATCLTCLQLAGEYGNAAIRRRATLLIARGLRR